MSIFGMFVAMVFVGCYVGMMYSTRIEGARGKILQWGCWLTALILILICYLIVPQVA